jgi:oligopeptide transport system ATP-binding protein
MSTEERELLVVRDLKMHFPIKKGLIPRTTGYVKAVDGVSFSIERGKTLGLVGESGCGKTTTGKCILRIFKATSGEVLFDGKDILNMPERDYKKIRRQIQMIFQDPYGSLDPRQTAFSIVKEMYEADGKQHTAAESKQRVEDLFRQVGLPVEMGSRYPHEMSGGQRQRLGIARALSCGSKLIICDEPVSALDVSIQAQVINLFRSLQQELGLTYLFIAHDLAVVRHIADRIAVMYLGHIVELMDGEEFSSPLHPYSIALLSAVPEADYDKEQQKQPILLKGEIPSPIHAPSGCAFHPRCPYATERCRKECPSLQEYRAGHYVACHNLETVLALRKENARVDKA